MLRNVLGVVSLSVVLWSAVPAQVALAEDKYPSRTITWLIPYGPAGGFDLHSRAMIVGMKKALGVNIIIRNRPGAGGNIAWNLTWG
jgi:tripartite-type tricarboxylate transporter receptor subunit TctC